MREEGYYWVKYCNEWQVGYWFYESWKLFYEDGEFFKDTDFEEIDERRITRTEPYPPEYWKASNELDKAVKDFYIKNGLPIPDHYDKGRTKKRNRDHYL